MANPICHNCNLRILSHAPFVFCTLCQLKTHIKCLNLYSPADTAYATDSSDNWSCPTCLRDIFPFFDIDNLTEFISLSNPTYLPDQLNLDQLIFNPFDLNEEGGVLDDIDPDSNFYNTHRQIIPNSKYMDINEINKKIDTSSNSISILHLNIRSLPKNFKSFKNLTSLISNKFSIIALTETWAKPHNIDLFNLEDYHHESLTRPNKAGGGYLNLYR